MNTRLLTAILCFVAVTHLSSCTPEKADALLTAIRAFELQAGQALTAYENLFKEYKDLKKESHDEIFDQAYDAVATRGGKNMTFEQAIANVGQLEAGNVDTRIEEEFQQLKNSYSLLSQTYRSLPGGSLLGARYVSCGRMAVVKLTQQLVNFSVDVNRSPLYPVSLRQDFAEFKALSAQGAANKEKARRKFDSFTAGVDAYEEKHKSAIALTLAAAEQGKKLNELLARYDSLSISDILAVIQYGFAFAGSLKGVDISQVSTSLNTVKREMEKDEYWQRVASIPLVSIAQCSENSE